ncbi:hypothetical protein J6590_021470 [Homalodisca vitripennis]|nr:hypothetical protein J6590_021470 [Homalodisca vitripennis]
MNLLSLKRADGCGRDEARTLLAPSSPWAEEATISRTIGSEPRPVVTCLISTQTICVIRDATAVAEPRTVPCWWSIQEPYYNNHTVYFVPELRKYRQKTQRGERYGDKGTCEEIINVGGKRDVKPSMDYYLTSTGRRSMAHTSLTNSCLNILVACFSSGVLKCSWKQYPISAR